MKIISKLKSEFRRFSTRFRRFSTRFLLSPIRDVRVAKAVEPIRGQFPDQLQSDELVVVGMMRDAELHVESFVKHHLALGAKQIVLLDNGSVDSTVQLASQMDQVTLLRCTLPFSKYKYAMRRYLVKTYGQKCWALAMDIDERFDFPCSQEITLKDLLLYLNQEGYTAVTGQMLDLYSDTEHTKWPTTGDDLVQQSCWYDLESITTRPLKNRQGRSQHLSALKHHKGGVRFAGFEMQDLPTLTKFPLLFPSAGVLPSESSSHNIRGGKLADISCLIKHYKFHGKFVEQCQAAVTSESYFRQSLEYRQYLHALESDSELNLKTDRSQKLEYTDQLIDDDFLVVSDAYRSFVQQQQGFKSKVAA
ncbi:MAG: hypothetical protein COA78_33140 [Blastopirellula sp.]|nr:MAG: hypothetical protein COA78_33140 [Blastopirellula sp.]